MPGARFTDKQIVGAFTIWPNVLAVAEGLGMDIRALQRRLHRMRVTQPWRAAGLPAPRSGKRRWARRPPGG